MPFFFFLFLSGLLAEGPESAWRVVGVQRLGPPPYTDGEGRLYRLEGPPKARVQIGQMLVLSRPGEPGAKPGTLKVLSLGSDYALAQMHEKGNTFPLKGDECKGEASSYQPPLVVQVAAPSSGAPLPTPSPLSKSDLPMGLTQNLPLQSLTSMEKLLPLKLGAAAERVPQAPRYAADPKYTETLFYLRNRGALSPAGQAKLKSWVDTWGTTGRWVLLLPSSERPEGLLQEREMSIRGFLQEHGVMVFETRRLPEASLGKYDQAHICFHPLVLD